MQKHGLVSSLYSQFLPTCKDWVTVSALFIAQRPRSSGFLRCIFSMTLTVSLLPIQIDYAGYARVCRLPRLAHRGITLDLKIVLASSHIWTEQIGMTLSSELSKSRF